jgi:hypothetical protein
MLVVPGSACVLPAAAPSYASTSELAPLAVLSLVAMLCRPQAEQRVHVHRVGAACVAKRHISQRPFPANDRLQ